MTGRPNHDVTRFMAGAATFPVAIRGTSHGAAVGAGGRLSLLPLATRAQVPGPARRAAKVPARRLEFSTTLTAGSYRHMLSVSNIFSITLPGGVSRRGRPDLSLG